MQRDVNDEHLILEAVEKFLQSEVRPHAHRLEKDDIYPAEIVEQMKEMGLFGCIIDSEYGGMGLSASTYAKIVERIASVWMSISGIINSHLIMAWAVQRNGTEEQKRHYLPKFATGELRGGLGLTEPDAGTDLQAIRTTAVRDGDHYVINGTKTWITNSMYGNTIALLVKTDPHAQPRTQRHEPVHRPRRDRASTSRASWKSSATAASTPASCSSRTTVCRPSAWSGAWRARACSTC